jgi:hypothetical protein
MLQNIDLSHDFDITEKTISIVLMKRKLFYSKHMSNNIASVSVTGPGDPFTEPISFSLFMYDKLKK